jgi:hypothetical protein
MMEEDEFPPTDRPTPAAHRRPSFFFLKVV